MAGIFRWKVVVINPRSKGAAFMSKLAVLVAFVFCAQNVAAQSLMLSCTAKAVYGRVSDLSVEEREGHSPSIMINVPANVISYEYERGGQAFKFIYEIKEQIDGVLWAEEPSLTGPKNHLSFDLNSLSFSTSHLSGKFNTLKFGRCLKTI
jgi:hypothetical protein